MNFSGKGLAICHLMYCHDNNYIAEVEVTIDGQPAGIVKLPADNNKRRQEVFYKYDFEDGDHTVSLKWLNPNDSVSIDITRAVVYEEI